MNEYIVDSSRLLADLADRNVLVFGVPVTLPANGTEISNTGIFVRAKLGDKWGSYDISELTLDSLRMWLRSRGGANEWAENVVCMLLGHALTAPANQGSVA